MRRYFFHLRDGGRGYVDHAGVEFADDAAALAHARSVAAELVKNREKIARHWRIEVQDEGRGTIFVTPLVSQDRTLDHLAPASKQLLEGTVHRRAALRETVAETQTILRKSRAVVARSRGRPHLVVNHGEKI